ncbi:hypothetical protein MalM25_30250 [Planctomycetes bacterium MalM25]|nr:hypothetical protein MalM25_30250 [Planctomycetes bacterium MalM25]
MAQEEDSWDESDREDLRETLRWVVVGESRLAQSRAEEIIDSCKAVYIEDTAPEDEFAQFEAYAQLELNRFVEKYESEKKAWPDKTECDRLDAVQESLQEKGIVLWQAAPCCDSCTMGEFSDRVDSLEKEDPRLRERLRGYAFFIDQNMAEMLSDGPIIDVYLGYGSIGGGDEIDEDEYRRRALAIGHEVVEELSNGGLKVEWNGDFSKKIGLSIDWKRRTPLQ